VRRLVIAMLLGAVVPAAAQESASFRLREQVFNAGGHPVAGQGLESPSFRVGLDSVGESAIATALASASFKMDVGFAAFYLPPREVRNLRFVDHVGMVWAPEMSVGTYNLYRGIVKQIPASGYGTCLEHDLDTTAGQDVDQPPVGVGWFYLVTASNRLEEEGTKGHGSGGSTRTNSAPCP
jgi:hypothetical protein